MRIADPFPMATTGPLLRPRHHAARRTAAGERESISIEISSKRVGAAFQLAAIVITAILVASIALLVATNEQYVQAARSVALVKDTQLDLLTDRRLLGLHAATADAEATSARAELQASMSAFLRETLAVNEQDPEAGALVISATHHIGEYVEVARALDRDGDVEKVITGVRAPLDAALRTLGRLQVHEQADLDAARAKARHVSIVAYAVILTGAVLLFLAVTVTLQSIRREVIRPLLGLSASIRRFEAGDAAARSEPSGAAELRDLSGVFNGMADAIQRQRQGELVFLASVAHDLRNPLAALKFGVTALEAQEGTPAHRRTLRLLERQVDRLASMAGDLFDTMRIEAGSMELHREPLDLRAAASEVVALYAPTTPAHQLIVHVPDEPVVVNADPVRVAQVITNLVSNALKFSPDGGRVDVEVRHAGTEAIVEVCDHGIGIPPEAISDLFAPFRRHAAEIPGAGLGLSIVRRLVQAHGGAVEVESELGRGSTFRVRLPARPEVKDSGSTPAPEE